MKRSGDGLLTENLAEDRPEHKGSGVLPCAKSARVRAVEVGMEAIGARFLQMVDAAIPEPMRAGDSDNLHRARLILSFTLVLILLGIETGVFFAWFLSPEAAMRVQISLVIALVLTLLIPLTLRVAGSLTLALNLVITAAFIVTVTIFSVIGGINASLIHWCALFPVLAAFMGSRASAWAWTVISIGIVSFFIVADAENWPVVDAVGFTDIEGSVLWLQSFINVVSWLGILLAMALLFENHAMRQTYELATKNTELEFQATQRHQAEQRSQYLAYYDELTGLPNRRLFLEQLSAAISQTSRLDRMVGLLFLDLDRFKEVNDLHGHALGDQLLQQVAERLRDCVRDSDRVSHTREEEEGNVARLGGDEFTILLSGIHGHRDAALVSRRILARLEESFKLADLELFIGASIGIALHSSGDMDAGDLLRNADLAMYQAKNAGKNNFKFHEESMNTDIATRNSMTDALRSALENEELELHFQLIIDAHTGHISGVEGLIRWSPPGKDPVPAETLIDIAEESGLIIPLGNWVIRHACRQYRAWQDSGIELKRIAVNVSAEQFRRGSVVDVVRKSLNEFDMQPNCLEIEITEGAMMVDEEKTLRALQELKLLGVKVALDDFGTGYSSLSYVHRFPVDALKIDRSFVTDVESDRGAKAISMAVIALAHQLGLKVVGEGVENRAQEEFLRDNGCDELQGYLYSKPLPAEEIVSLLSGRDYNFIAPDSCGPR
jgi:diguanylate cyclase (GGDEF)-like protein